MNITDKLRAALQEIADLKTELPARGDYERGFNDARYRVRKIADTALAAAPASAAEPVSADDIRQACILLERACAYAGDAIPASILREAQELHARIGVTNDT